MKEIQLPEIGAGRLDHSALSEICQEILSADHNALQARQDYSINLQRGKRPNHADTDTAPNKLITFIKQDVWQRPSYGLFYKLLNNYTRETGVAEVVTPQKEAQISEFLDHVLASEPMKVAHNFLASRSLVAKEAYHFKAQLHQMFFRLYSREARDDTCGFEHIFVGESKQGNIQGLHNWLQFYNLEQQGSLDYRGYIFPRHKAGSGDSEVTPDDLIISVQFNVDGQVKDVSSIWLGTSPEVELALYTVCFVAGGERSVIELRHATGLYEVEIRCYHIRSKYGDKVGSAFPVLLSKLPQHYQQQQPAWQSQPPPKVQEQHPAMHYPQQQPQAPWQQQALQQPQQQQDMANQGCGSLVMQILRTIFGSGSK